MFSSVCSPSEDRAPGDEIYECPIFNWVPMTRSIVPVMATRVVYHRPIACAYRWLSPDGIQHIKRINLTGLILGFRPANERRLSLAGRKPRISPVLVWRSMILKIRQCCTRVEPWLIDVWYRCSSPLNQRRRNFLNESNTVLCLV